MAFDPDAYLAQKTQSSGGFDPDAYLAEKAGAPVEAAPAQQEQPNATLLQRFQASRPGRVMQGMRDQIDEGAAMLPKGLQAVTSLGGTAENPVSQFFGDEASRVQAMNKQSETEYQAARQATYTPTMEDLVTGNRDPGFDGARLAGNIVSPVNLAVASKFPMAFRGVQALKAGALTGAVGGALTPGGDVDNPDYWQDKAINTAKGAGIGLATAGVVAGGARMIRPETNKAAKELIEAGVTPTPGQILGGAFHTAEDKLRSVPILGDMIVHGQKTAVTDFNRAALNKALKPIGKSVDDVGRAGVLQVKEKLGAAYDNLLPKLSFKPDAQFRAEFQNLQGLAKGLGAKEHAKFNSIMRDVIGKVSPNGSMKGETFKIVESKLAAEAKKFTGSTDAYQKELGDALTESLRIIRDTLPRNNPQYASELKAINTGYANYTRIRQAASSTAAGANDGIFTPAQLAAAVKTMDKSAGKGASATGKALMQDFAEAGTNILSSKVADSGTAGRVLLGGGALSAGVINPLIPIGLGLGGLPFIGAGKKLAAAALTNRGTGQTANKLSELVRKGSPFLSGAAPLALHNGNKP